MRSAPCSALFLLALVSFAQERVLQAQTVAAPYAFSVLAGLPQHGSVNGTTGTGPVAEFFRPEGVALDSRGNLYVTDNGNGVIRKITPAGVVSTFAGTAGSYGSADGLGPAARFEGVTGIAVDNQGNLYVSDQVNNTIRKITPQGNVSTLAGMPGRTGFADGTGASAEFTSPAGVAVDASGTVFVADTGANLIRKISSTGVVTTLAGTVDVHGGSADGTGSAAQFNEPFGVAVDAGGNVYVADQENNAIRKVTPAGVVTTLAGNPSQGGSADGTGSAAEFETPAGIAVDAAGNVFVADYNNNTIRMITPQGAVTTLAGTAGPGASVDGVGPSAAFFRPVALAVDSTGDVYIADYLDDTIRKITPSRVVSTFAGTVNVQGYADGGGAHAEFDLPLCVALDPSGNLFVSDTLNSEVREISPAGEVTTFAGTAGVPGFADGSGFDASFEAPAGVASDAAGDIYVTDTVSGTIRKITPGGVVSTLAGTAGVTGSADGSGPAAQFNQPASLAVDGSGNLYVADSGNNTLRKVTPSGNVTTLAGKAGAMGSTDGTGSAARFNQPFGVAIDSAGNIFVGDINNNTIRKVTPSGTVTTFVGSPGVIGSADGTGSSALLNEPGGLAFDSAGNLIFADTDNGTIRRATPAGSVFTLAGTAGVVGGADGIGPAASFNTPVGVAVDHEGNIYVADLYNSTIRLGVPSLLPTVTVQPVSQAVATGGTAVFAFTSTGSPAPTFQWSHDGVPIPGATGATLILKDTTAADAGVYTCAATNASGSAATSPATLTVEDTSDPGRLINLSCRAQVGTGSNVLIVGFAVGGAATAGSDPLLIRASGPALTPLGVAGVLPDPDLELHNSASILASNKSWGGLPSLSAVFSQVGAFSWSNPSSNDAALTRSLTAGTYSAVISGAVGDSGNALAEIYDATPPGTYTGASPRLVNLSARVQVGTGSGVLIAGFVIGGSTAKTVLLRASGPALVPFGVAATLPDPLLELHNSGGLLARNLGWGGDPQIAAVANSVGAFSWGLSATADSALLITLAPGAYTAEVSGSRGDTGVALIEVYELP